MASADSAADRPDDLDRALRAAFGMEPPGVAPSVLKRLRQKTGSQFGVHLQGQDDADAAVRIDDEARALRDPAGRYQVLGEIGRGGVGVVYKGRDLDLGRDVAMKVLRAEYADRPEILERFVEEAQIGGQLQHPGIVPVYEFGLQHGDRPYFAMKLVKGQTLAALLAQRAGPDTDRVRYLAIFEQICQTLGYAHARAVVHRDLKPANVMLGSFGEVQVVDWGFAKVLRTGAGPRAPTPVPAAAVSLISTVRSDADSSSQSVVGSMLGTPAYMPPEQARGDVEQMDERSDVFGLGAILCEILTGRPPYLEQDGDVLAQAASARLAPAMQRLDASGADAAMVALCRQCLAPARAARPASGKEVADAVAAFLSSVEERARQAQLRAAEARVRARATLWLAAAAVLLLAAAGGGYYVFEHEAQARVARAALRVESALREGNLRLGEARTADPGEVAPWTRAADAAKQAASLAGEPDVPPEQQSAVAVLLAATRAGLQDSEREAARKAKYARMQQRLTAARSSLHTLVLRARPSADLAGTRTRIGRRYDEVYGQAFADFLDGRDLLAMTPAEAGAALRGPLAVELAAALDDWATWPLRYEGKPDGAPGSRAVQLRAIAAAVDPDPWRNRLRELLCSPTVDRAAVRALRQAADFANLPAASLRLFAGAVDRSDDGAELVAVLQLACERHPDDFDCAFDLGTLRLLAGNLGAAEVCFRIARALRPDSALVHSNLGAVLREQGRSDEAIASFDTSLAIDPGNALAHNNLGLAQCDLGRPADAIRCFQAALRLDPDYAMCAINLAHALSDLGRREEAVATLQDCIARAPANVQARHDLGSLLADLGRNDEAIASYRAALVLAPGDESSLNDLALALWTIGDDGGAEAACQQVLAADPENGPARYNHGCHLANVGDFDGALADLRRAAATFAKGKDGFARHWHQQAVARLDEIGKEAAELPRRLAIARGEQAPTDAAELAAAAGLMHRRGRTVLAMRCWQRAFAADPGLVRRPECRYAAACSAAMAGTGHGEDVADLPAAERETMRTLARQWLQAQVEDWQAALGRDDEAALAARQAAAQALQDRDLRCVRAETEWSTLPADEAGAWRRLWASVATVAGRQAGR